MLSRVQPPLVNSSSKHESAELDTSLHLKGFPYGLPSIKSSKLQRIKNNQPDPKMADIQNLQHPLKMLSSSLVMVVSTYTKDRHYP